jgi:DNA primase
VDIVKVLEFYGAEGVPEGVNRPLRCPFHDDRTASASVDTEAGLFNCHGCGIGGDAIKLIQIQEGVSFEDAKRRAEKITGESYDNVSASTVDVRGGSSLLPQWARDKFVHSGNLPPWIRG